MLSVRVAAHFTGRPILRAAHSVSTSSGNGPPLSPKPPPTSGEITRMWFSGTWKHVRELHAHAVRILRASCGGCSNCRPRCSRRWRPAAPSQPAKCRLLSTRNLTTCFALAKAASVASLLPNISLNAMLPFGLSSQTLGAPSLAASSRLTTRRQRLVVDFDQFGGVARLRERLGHHEGDAIADVTHALGVEDGLPGTMALGRTEILRHRMRSQLAEMVGLCVGAGQHASTPGAAFALAVSTRLIRAWACGDSTVTP